MAIIISNNGQTTILTSGQQISSITPEPNTYVIGVDSITGEFEKLDPSGNIFNFESITGGTGQPVIETTYSELVNSITGNTLNPGSYYVITDFKTCYDQPDFDYDGNPITTGNYKEGLIEPILVLATSGNTISSIAYQPTYPNDRITYDWTFNQTEVTGGQAYGRITERIDEFNNRTDYDHRNILFKRYKLYTHRPGQPLNGTIEILGDGTINGTNTNFTGLTIGDIIYIPNVSPSNFEIINITDSLTMSVSGDTINAGGPGLEFYKTIEETNDTNGYFSYKRTNVKTDDYLEYTTFGNALFFEYAKNNYVGNLANNYQNVGNGFLLSNNVFLEGQYESNKFGDYCYNNTFGTDNQNNVWGDFCYQNVSTNDIDDNVIGHYFTNNLINTNLSSNSIGNYFDFNKLLSENDTDFENNIIGNSFNNNIIYSSFYRNEILYNFNNNTIGDFGNLSNFEFYRNRIGDSFNNNTVRTHFQNNKIGSNFQNNQVNGDFINNNILNGFNNNNLGYWFWGNEIGNAFNNNTITDNFYSNKIDYYFYSNKISYDFFNNNISTNFINNLPSNNNLFGWNDLSTVSTRTYDTLYNSLNGGVGNKILGKEFVMRVMSTLQYFKIKFTQWTQGGNGGGFQYERTEIDSGGNVIGSTIYFTKTNYGSEIDIIVPSVVELTRDSDGGLYNTITDTPPFGGAWPGPGDTEWNSIYTEPNNGKNFAYNKIGNYFQNNIIDNDFGYGGSSNQGNIINDNFQNNLIGSYMYNNVIGNFFTNNTIDIEFESNQIQNYFIGNTIGTGFQSNQIGNYFGNTGSGTENQIGNNFSGNSIGHYFGNDGSHNSGGNVINNDFYDNLIGNKFYGNTIDPKFYRNDIGNDFFGNSIQDIPGNSNFQNNKIGNRFNNNTTDGYFYGNVIGGGFNNNEVGSNFYANEIGFGFNNNTIGENFYINVVLYYFNYNNIGNSTYYNYFKDYFGNNTTTTDFNNNYIKTGLYNIDFTDYYGNLTSFTYSAPGNTATDNTYTGLTQNSTSGIGVNATFDIEVSGGIVVGVTGSTQGKLYENGNLLTIIGSQIGGTDGVDDVVITVTGISPLPSVYGNYTCDIFERQGGTKRLSYYDSSDILTITNINQ